MQLIPLPTGVPFVPYPAYYDSNYSKVYKTRRRQYAGGFQAVQIQGDARKSETIWDAVIHLDLAQVTELDTTLTQLRGIFPFRWSPDADPNTTRTWLCGEWRIEYAYPDFYIFTAKFLQQHDGNTRSITMGSWGFPRQGRNSNFLDIIHQVNLQPIYYPVLQP